MLLNVFRKVFSSFFRIRLSVRNLLLIPYLPMGFLVLVIRLCMTLQLVLVFALIPNGWFKR